MTPEQLVTEYLTHKRALGHQFRSEESVLRAFFKRLGNYPLGQASLAQMQEVLHVGDVTPDTIARRYRILRGFCQYASGRHGVQLPVLPLLAKQASSSFIPYIYTQEELKRLLQAASAACQSCHAKLDDDTMRTIVLALYGAGLRLGEALRLNKQDVDLLEAILIIRHTKFHKSRLVPIGKDLTQVLEEYSKRDERHRRHAHYNANDEAFFIMRTGERACQSVVECTWRRLRKLACVERNGGPRNQPRLHDLRHSAAVHRLIAWYRSGIDLNQLLPMLATYLGHATLAGTQHYLTLTPELLGEASTRFEHYALGARDE